MKLTAKTRKTINKGLTGLPLFHATPFAALDACKAIIAPFGLVAGLVWCAPRGHVRIRLTHGEGSDEQEVEGTFLIFATHPMYSGRTELVSYLS